ncbi:MAG TPA: hypothetical protein VHE36_01320 [Sphingomicrobium sp.]|nr:hypothetical protein [Sphingomicrobium sp.]
MDCKLLTAAALVAAITMSPAPAFAEHRVGIGIPNAKSSHYVGAPTSPDVGTCGMRGGHGGHDRAFRCDGFADGWAYADGAWALYNNRSWEPSSYNDWWHDRPDRAYPRWVNEQRMHGSCDPDRMWWSGTGWHC